MWQSAMRDKGCASVTKGCASVTKGYASVTKGTVPAVTFSQENVT